MAGIKQSVYIAVPPPGGDGPESPKTKKADAVEHPKAFDRVGLLTNKPPGDAELLFT
jgi:hypothetical protein